MFIYICLYVHSMLFIAEICLCEAVSVSASSWANIQALSICSAQTDTCPVGKSPHRGGRRGQQYHLADVSSGTMISEVIG